MNDNVVGPVYLESYDRPGYMIGLNSRNEAILSLNGTKWNIVYTGLSVLIIYVWPCKIFLIMTGLWLRTLTFRRMIMLSAIKSLVLELNKDPKIFNSTFCVNM